MSAVTEAEWLLAGNPHDMIPLLCGKGSRRKVRWFAIACCRRVVPLVLRADAGLSQGLRDSLEVCGNEADDEACLGRPIPLRAGQLSEAAEAQGAAARAAAKALDALFRWHGGELWNSRSSRFGVATEADVTALGQIVRAAVEAIKCDAPAGWNTVRDAERARHADVLRDVFRTVFQLPPVIDPNWLAWNDGTVPKIAHAIYNECAFDRLPILADAPLGDGVDGRGDFP